MNSDHYRKMYITLYPQISSFVAVNNYQSDNFHHKTNTPVVATRVAVGTGAHIEGGAHTGGGAHITQREGVGPAHTQKRKNKDIVETGVRNREP